MRVWVTRAEPEARRTAEALVRAGHAPMVEPLVHIQALPDAGARLAQALAGAGALAFTSLAAVRAFDALRPGDRDLPVFAVGAATAQAARDAGFPQVISADGDVAALAAVIAAHAPNGPVLHPRAREPAGDLIGDLAARGVPAISLAIYQTLPQSPSAAFLAGLDQAPPHAVLIHSGKAAAALAHIFADRPRLAAQLALVSISEAAAQPLSAFAFARRAIAEAPTEADLLTALDR
ncbi:MAG TPA: uroporphyrinogen-III synthase [Caulobacteraceae bacterium]|nr:uroporphyrinogen-III synthase [Caulobacteraceae bacterium]